jgi:pimeloyl-ACP methyl ester carboxylesterase
MASTSATARRIVSAVFIASAESIHAAGDADALRCAWDTARMRSDSRLARLLQFVLLVHVAVAVTWVSWRWPVSVLQACIGVLVVVLAGPAVLALEFAFAARANRIEARAPQARFAAWLRAWASESAHLYGVFAWRQPFRWRAVGDRLDARCAGLTGVVFVHGFMCNRGFWNPWMQRLRDEEHAFAAVNLEPVYGAIDSYAPTIDAAVTRVTQATGRPPILVCHSMGGLAARAWWRASAGAQPIAALVTIGSPHRGTWMGRFSTHLNGRQMRLHSAWLRELHAHEASLPLPPATCWYSNCDNMVFPASTATLPNADNRFIPGEPHVALAFHLDVVEGTLSLLSRLDAAGQGKSVTGTALENS